MSDPAPATLSQSEVDEGKIFAILSYVLNLVGVPFWLLPLVLRNNDFALFHAKQCLLLWIAYILAMSVSGILMFVAIGLLILPVVMLAGLILNIFGLVAALNGQSKPLPLLGTYAIEWFKGIRKVPA